MGFRRKCVLLLHVCWLLCVSLFMIFFIHLYILCVTLLLDMSFLYSCAKLLVLQNMPYGNTRWDIVLTCNVIPVKKDQAMCFSIQQVKNEAPLGLIHLRSSPDICCFRSGVMDVKRLSALLCVVYIKYPSAPVCSPTSNHSNALFLRLRGDGADIWYVFPFLGFYSSLSVAFFFSSC